MKLILLCLLFSGVVFSEIPEISLDHLEHMQSTLHEINNTLYRHVVGLDRCPSSAAESGLYKLACDRCQKLPTVLCDKPSSFDDDGGLWIVIQQRFDGSEDFNRFWDEYRDGFGVVSASTEFWLGLESVHQLTSAGNYELLIELRDELNRNAVARYSRFRVGSGRNQYRLEELGTFNGTAGFRRREGSTKLEDNLRYHLGQPFSTRDQDYDQSRTSCAEYYGGGWWYKECAECVLNGSYKVKFYHHHKSGIVWPPMTKAAKRTRMMIRRI